MEQRLGVAVPGVLACFASSAAVVAAYAQVSQTAAYVLLPLPVWLSIASILVGSIWKLNGEQPMYPIVGHMVPE